MRDLIQRYVQTAHSSFRQAPRVIGVIVLVFMLVAAPALVGTSQAQSDEVTVTVTAYDETGAEVGTVSLEANAPVETPGIAYDMIGSRDMYQSEEQIAHWDNVRGEGGELMESFEGDRSEYELVEPFSGESEYTIDETLSTDGDSSLRGDPYVGNSQLYNDDVYIDGDFSFDMRSTGQSTDRQLSSGVMIFYNYTSEDDSDGFRFNLDSESGEMRLLSGGMTTGESIGYEQGEWYTFEVEITGDIPEPPTEPIETELTLETRDLYTPNSTHPYEVILENVSEVTENATVVSENSTLLSVDQEEHTMTSIDDENATGVVNVTATYTHEGEQYNTTKQVVVASPTVENLELLPTGLWRTYAVMSDNTIFALIIAAFMSVAAARFAGAFAGLATAEMVIVIGWLGGYVGLGIAMVSVFMCLFIGLNLAANIDYSITRMER